MVFQTTPWSPCSSPSRLKGQNRIVTGLQPRPMGFSVLSPQAGHQPAAHCCLQNKQRVQPWRKPRLARGEERTWEMLQRKGSEQDPYSQPLKGFSTIHALPHGVPTEMGEGDSRHRGTKDAAGWGRGLGASTVRAGSGAGWWHQVRITKMEH